MQISKLVKITCLRTQVNVTKSDLWLLTEICAYGSILHILTESGSGHYAHKLPHAQAQTHDSVSTAEHEIENWFYGQNNTQCFKAVEFEMTAFGDI